MRSRSPSEGVEGGATLRVVDRRQVDYREMMKSLRKKGPQVNLYLIWGEEELLRGEMVEKIRTCYLPDEGDNRYQSEVFTGDRITADAIGEAVSTPSFLGGEKLIVVRCEYGKYKKELNELSSLFSGLPSDICLVFDISGKIDRRTKFYKHAKKHGESVEVKSLYKNQIPAWLIDRAEEMGLSLSREAARLLVETIGQDLRQLVNELEKLKTYVGSESEIGLEDVRRASSRIKAFPQNLIFSLVDAVGQRSTSQALKHTAEAIRDGQTPHRIIYMIIRQLRLIYWTKLLLDDGHSTRTISSELSQPPFVVKKCAGQSRNFTTQELLAFLEDAAGVDYRVKRGQLAPRRGLETMIVRLCGEGEDG